MQNFEQLEELVRPYYQHDDSSHDYTHVQRVLKTGKKLAETEEVDLEVLLPAILLHDVVNLPKNHPKRKQASKMAADLAKRLMKQVGYDPATIERTCQVIIEHSFSLGRKPTSKEAAILQDADKLDALGAIGILRAATCGSRMGAHYYHEDEPFRENRPLDDKKYTLDHFETKLFKLPSLMNTHAGKAEAERRVGFMKNFINEFKQEIQ